MKYGEVVTLLYRLASLVDASTLENENDDKKKKKKQVDENMQTEKREKLETFKQQVLEELRISLLSHGTLFEGCRNSIERIVDIFELIKKNSESVETELCKAVESWIFPCMSGIRTRLVEITDTAGSLYSEYVHLLPRINFLLQKCTDSLTNLQKYQTESKVSMVCYIYIVATVQCLFSSNINHPCRQLSIYVNYKAFLI